MSPNQLRDLNIFNLILEVYGWDDPSDTEKRLEAGEEVNPEGFRVWRGAHTTLQVRFNSPVNVINLAMTDHLCQERLQFHFFFNEKPERVLEWVVAAAPNLTAETYPDWLNQTEGLCDVILLEISESEIYEFKPST